MCDSIVCVRCGSTYAVPNSSLDWFEAERAWDWFCSHECQPRVPAPDAAALGLVG